MEIICRNSANSNTDGSCHKMSEAVLGAFSEVKFIKTRSVMQIVIEVAIERADESLKALGGIPLPSEERWVGVALAPKERKDIHTGPMLDKFKRDMQESEEIPSENGQTTVQRRPFKDLKLSNQAGIRCSDPQFWDFLAETRGEDLSVGETAADFTRRVCGVSSRSELDMNDLASAKWRKLEDDFQAYLNDLRYAGSTR